MAWWQQLPAVSSSSPLQTYQVPGTGQTHRASEYSTININTKSTINLNPAVHTDAETAACSAQQYHKCTPRGTTSVTYVATAVQQ